MGKYASKFCPALLVNIKSDIGAVRQTISVPGLTTVCLKHPLDVCPMLKEFTVISSS